MTSPNARPLADGFYWILNNNNFLRAGNARTVVSSTTVPQNATKWHILFNANDATYTIWNADSDDIALDMPAGSDDVVTWKYHRSNPQPNQKWAIRKTGVAYTLVPISRPTLVMAWKPNVVSTAAAKDGATNGQQWLIIPAPPRV
ncbi:hypothetical protein FN846DRAFT_919266 [Sphaerosporella brunnea]|uniref:Ricin B lectin domain-containing protein n=1 Tax=Sphaerosporella brunnea TaxID=1250544 RepID=A0A5J5EX02_9PEZI|nr:hypothetical protein FN846DRAFT_919266 [Sphaerosporella brunnea]